LAERLEMAERLEPYTGQMWDGSVTAHPVLHFDDFSEIPFLIDISGVEEYQHRARLRAMPGDLFAAVTPPTPGYEEYCRERLGLGEVEFLLAEPVGGPMAVAQACGAGAVWRRLVQRTREAGGLVIHPFMGIEAAWTLGRRLAAEAGAEVSVVAPPPPATWIANDKALFGEVVELTLGDGWLVETHRAAEIAALAGHLLRLAEYHRRVALKRLRCASAMGNAVFEAAALTAAGAAGVEALVSEFLARTEWNGYEEVLAVAWEETDISPSTQMWVPPAGAGLPRLDGIYEQILKGEQKVFIGSRPSGLPSAVNDELAAASLEVATALQALGYVGRCSFDFVVVGDPESDCQLRFTECNGRWGGTSTPMALLDRLVGPPRPPCRAQDVVHPRLVGASFADLVEQVGEEVFDGGTGRGRFVFYNTGPLADFGKIDVIAIGSSREEADAALEEDLPRLLGL
jgi:hypothetical protein